MPTGYVLSDLVTKAAYFPGSGGIYLCKMTLLTGLHP